MGRKSNINQQELMEFKKQFEAERRKSVSVEEAIMRLQKDNKNKANQIYNLQNELNEYKAEIEDLVDKNQKTTEIIEAIQERC